MATPRFAWGIDIGNRALKAESQNAVLRVEFSVKGHKKSFTSRGVGALIVLPVPLGHKRILMNFRTVDA